ncbi:MAG TPA: CHAD domain-containing protein [Solirubrobacteraceae bacterium]|nr:CHAD domain-containing protein [Solirubrobacteraceae bacterium]
MAYKFEPDESVRHALTRCAREQLDRSVSELSDGIGTDPVEAIHSARKAIKKERSLLRLVRGAMPREQRRRENAALREVGRSLSGARDAEVMIASIDELSDRFAGQLPETAFQRIREHLEARRSAAAELGNCSVVDERVVQHLAAVRARVDEWQLRGGGWKSLESGLLRSYERGRQTFGRARVSSEMEDLHSWRKRVKDLWYHERLLAQICGPTVRGHAKELDLLSDLLGDDHDLALLRHELTQTTTPATAGVDAVVNLIDHRRSELQTEATRLGERVYAETVKAYRRRMRRSWTVGRGLARAPLDENPRQLAAATR